MSDVTSLTDEQLRAAAQELARRSRAEHEAYMRQVRLREELAAATSHREFALKFAGLLNDAGWESPFTSLEDLDEVAQRDLLKLWADVRELVDDQDMEMHWGRWAQ